MTNLDAMCQQTFDRHQQLLAQAARRRLLSTGVQGHAASTPARPWRVTVATWLRRVADWLEPVGERPQVGHRSAIG